MLSTDNALLLLIVIPGIGLYVRHRLSLKTAALNILKAVVTIVPLLTLPLRGRTAASAPTEPASKQGKGEWVWVKASQRVLSNRDIEALVFDILERVVQDRRHMGCAVRAYKNGKPQGVLFQHRNGASELLTVKGWKDVSGDFYMFAPEQRVRLTAPPEEPPPFPYNQ
jgi:hypothetical protein